MKMKPAIPMTTTILVSVLAAGLASAQSPTIIQNTRNTMNGVSNQATAGSNAALGVQQRAPTTTSATQTPSKSTLGVATPKKASSSPVAKKTGTKPVVGVVAKHSAWPKTAGVAKDKPAAAAGGAGSGAGDEKAASEQPLAPDSKYNANGRRDPFLSPVVSHASGSGCSTGKKCLEIGAINLKGVVRAENGFIAVVSNGMNKAYFLRENDPVFNGYVMKITGDSVVFQETLQDRMGKTFTREVVKKITTPAV